MAKEARKPREENEQTRQRFRLSLYLSMTALTLLLALGTVMFHHLEGWSWVTSFYFTVSTLTTVGYGDLFPTSETSRLFTAVFIIVGVGMSLAAITLVGSSYLELMERRILRERKRLKQLRQEKKDNEDGA